MILGRPTNLWLGLVTATLGFIQVTAPAVFPGIDVAALATVLGGLGLLLGAFIALIANQPPTLSPGDTFHVQTPEGQPNYVTTVASPPAADPAPTPLPEGAE